MVKGRFSIFLVLLLVTCKCFASAFGEKDSVKEKTSSGFLLFPFVLKSPETNWGFGAASAYFFKPEKKDAAIRTSDMNVVALYTLRNQLVIVLGSTVFFSKEKSILRFQGSYSYYPDKCWGIGNSTLSEAQEDYSIKQIYFNPQLLKRFFRHWYAGFTYEFQHVEDFTYPANGVFDQQDINGRYGGNISGLGFLLTWDTRNNAYSSSKGFFFEFSAKSFSKNIGSDFSFGALALDFRDFVSLSKDRVLAAQLIVKDNTGTIPIRQLAMLGGSEIMRGYYQGRFMDKDLLAFQTELRQHIYKRFGIAGFAGVGEVTTHTRDFKLDALHFAYGAGVRIMVSKSEKLNLRVDFGIGKKSNGLYVILKEAF